MRPFVVTSKILARYAAASPEPHPITKGLVVAALYLPKTV